MADIARLANVSKITVSRALSDSPLVRTATKESIRRIAREHGYRFNKTARNLRLQRQHTIALAFDSNAHHPLAEPFPRGILSHVAEALSNKGYDLLLCAETGASEDWSTAIASKPVDGVIVIGHDQDGAMVDGIRRANLPAILCGSDRVDDAFPTISSDNVRGGELAASRLYDVGRRDFLFLGDTENSEERQRWEGFDQMARRLGVRSLRQLPAGIGYNNGYEALWRLLDREGRCLDALFARNDMVAMGAIRAIERAGMGVPGDISVIGYDDIPMAAGFSPPLTTIAQNSRRTGEEIVSRILAMVEGQMVDSVKLPTTLVVRGSCA